MHVVIDGANKEISNIYVNIGGIWKPYTTGYANIGGIWKEFPSNGTPLGDIAVGTSVFMNVDGTSCEWIIVQQGNPDSTVYDSSCDGTWLLLKNLYVAMALDSKDNDYANSDVHAYLNGTFINLLDSDIKNAVKTVKIPYTNGTGKDGTLVTGENGLSTQVFLLSVAELGLTASAANVEGVLLNYFDGADTNKLIATLNGNTTDWWLRSPTKRRNTSYRVNTSGSLGSTTISNSLGIRPALIMPSETLVDDSMNVIS